jgi:hypothetical protein
MILLDILFFSTILSLIYVYAHIGKFRKTKGTLYRNDESFESENKKKENIIKNKEIYESDKYKDIYEDLPWEKYDDEYENESADKDENNNKDKKCKEKYMDEMQFISSSTIRRKPLMTIY